MNNKKLTSIILSVIVIAILLLSGPVSAITISVDTNKDTYYQADDSSIVITGTIDLETTEILNITEYVVQIKNSTSNLIKNCSISTDGTVSNCDNITASITYNGDYINGTRYGYGYGYSSLSGTYTTANQTFGYGYGYGYTAGTSNEIVVTVTWDINSDTEDNPDDYTSNVFAKAEGNGNTRYYTDSTEAEFTIKSGSAPSSDTDTGISSGGIYCGDGQCTKAVGEDCNSCSEDCGECPLPEPEEKEEQKQSKPKPAPKPEPKEEIKEEPPEPKPPITPLGAGIVISLIGLIIAVIIAVKIKMQ